MIVQLISRPVGSVRLSRETLARLLVTIAGALWLAVGLTSGAFASGLHALPNAIEPPATAHYASAYVYDGAPYSVQVRAGAIAPALYSGATAGAHERVTAARGSLPVASRLSVAANTAVGAAKVLTPLEQGAARVPSGWGQGVANSKGVGTRWFDPASKGNGIRIDQGVPGSPWATQQVDHVVVRSGGNVIGRSGEPIVGPIKANPDAHIPLSEWLNWSSWNAP